MVRVRCPECGAETDIVPRPGAEVVAAYCLRHREGVDGHVRAVYMELLARAGDPVVADLEAIAA